MQRSQIIKSLFIKTVYVFVVLLVLEGCQGCNQAAVAPSEYETISKLGGIPNLGNTCYMNSVLQIIAKLYPDVFASQASPLAQAGQVIVNKIKDDQEHVTREEAEAFYTELLKIAPTRLQKGRQEDASEAMQTILEILSARYSLRISIALSTPGRRSGEPDSARAEEYHLLQLPIDFNSDSSLNLRDCVNRYCIQQEVELADSITGKAQEQCRLSMASSKLLPIQLVRFNSDLSKIDKDINHTLYLTIPANIQYNPDGNTTDLHYNLQGFIIHMGSTMRSGHYVAYIRQAGQWKCYNDSTIKQVTLNEVEQAARQGYLYFYLRA